MLQKGGGEGKGDGKSNVLEVLDCMHVAATSKSNVTEFSECLHVESASNCNVWSSRECVRPRVSVRTRVCECR